VTAVRTTAASLLLTALLLAGLQVGVPVAARVPVALLVFLAAPGLALVGPGRALRPALRWSLVIGLSLSADLLGAVLLLSVHAFSARNVLGVLLVLELLAGCAHLAAGRRRRVAVVPAEELP
jgi:hypothetical protein